MAAPSPSTCSPNPSACEMRVVIQSSKPLITNENNPSVRKVTGSARTRITTPIECVHEAEHQGGAHQLGNRAIEAQAGHEPDRRPQGDGIDHQAQ